MRYLVYIYFTVICYNEVFMTYSTSQPNTQGVCLSKVCFDDAAALKESMDANVDPCTDFYQFACGGYINKATIRENQTSIGHFKSLKWQLNNLITLILQKPKKSSEPEAIKKVKDFYNSCINTDNIECNGPVPLLDLLEKLGGWPVLQGNLWNEDKFQWESLSLKMHNLGVPSNFLFNIEVESDYNPANLRYWIHISSYSIKTALLNESYANEYFQLMIDTALLLGANKADAQRDLLESLNFEISLAKIYKMDETSQEKTMTVSELNKLGPKMDWLKYLNSIFSKSISDDEAIKVLSPNYIEELLYLLQDSPKRVLANYIMWQLIVESSPYLNEHFNKLAKLNSNWKSSNRTEMCSGKTMTSFPIAVSSLYIRELIDPQTKYLTKQMVEIIRKEFEKIINETPWMDDKTKANAVDKLLAISERVAYPEELLNDTLIDNLYKNVLIEKNYFSNVLAIGRQKLYDEYNLIHTQVYSTKPDWHTETYATAAQVGAYYEPLSNTIYVPAGILQGIIYDKNRPMYMNYGAMGYIIGHELTHGFDSTGRFFDKDGKYAVWWDEITDQNYERRAQCLVQQYGNFTLPNGMKSDSHQTLAEDIADNGGLKEAYIAYQTWVLKNGPEPLLPNISFNQNQLFWLTQAMVWCEKSTNESLRHTIENDLHSPNSYRVNGPAMNIPAFSKDFNCKSGTPMNPKERCVVW